MQVNGTHTRNFRAMLVLLLALPLAVWSCQNNAGAEQAAEEPTEMTESAGEQPAGTEQPAADTTAQDTTQHSEHPQGSEHPNN